MKTAGTMFFEIFRFELWYRKSRRPTYVYFLIIFLLALLAITSPTSRTFTSLGLVSPNAPYIISNLIIAFSLFFIVVTSAVMGVAVVRDFDHGTEVLLFSSRINKVEYLLGRFFGSLIVLIAIHSGVLFGIMIGFALGNDLPWDVAWKGKALLPFTLGHYMLPFAFFTVTNAFTLGAFFFLSGALWRNTVVLYTQGIGFLILYQVGNLLFSDPDSRQIVALVDPFGYRTFLDATLYWTPSEQNSRVVEIGGTLLINRGLWLGMGFLALVITCLRFSFSSHLESDSSKKPEAGPQASEHERFEVPRVHRQTDTGAYVRQLAPLSGFYFKMVWREKAFIAIVISGLLLLTVNAMKLNHVNGTVSHPTTNAVVQMLANSFDMFLLAIAILYSAELIWKEKTVKLNLIADATPVPGFVNILSKFFGLGFVYVSLLGILMVSGIMLQVYNQYYEISLPAYLKALCGQTLVNVMLVTALSIFIQVIVNNKFVGITITIVALIVNGMLTQFGVEHSLWRFASGSLGVFSDMNSYGHFVVPFFWLKTYWLSFAGVLVTLAILVHGRGVEPRAKVSHAFLMHRSNRPLYLMGGSFFLSFLFCGTLIYYNTRVVNVFDTTVDEGRQLAEYEKLLKRYDGLPQPEITEVKLDLELYPSKREFFAEGYYYLRNGSTEPMVDIHVQHSLDKQLRIGSVSFDRASQVKESSERFRYFVYELNPPLRPGDSVRMDFSISFFTEGFQDGKTNTDIVFNGTFFNNAYFPSLGYNKSLSLQDDDLRLRHGLGSKERLPSHDDENARNTNLFGDDAHRIRFQATVSTEGDQTAIAPGMLLSTWKQGDRNYFRYGMEMPIGNFYSIVSARYAVRKDNWDSVELEIFHHPSHDFNVDRMITAMKDALTYNSRNFGAFQFDALRIMEFPRYTQSAQSFATAIPFSEGLGFVMKVEDPGRDLDMVYYLTAHEVSHQWWGHQVMEADVKGGTMLSESLSQYAALMVLKQRLPPETMRNYLRYELDRYLAGRRLEQRMEQPLIAVEKQPYIHYNKAALVFYSLQDYIGEDSVNQAIRRYLQRWAYQRAPYPTSVDLVNEIKKVTPDSLQYMVTDMFETITIYENQATSGLFEQVSGKEYLVTLKTNCKKYRADSVGTQTEVPLVDWMDVGVFAAGKDGSTRLIYLRKHRITRGDNTIHVVVAEKPTMAGIDPLYKLIDRHSQDNTVQMKSTLGFDVVSMN